MAGASAVGDSESYQVPAVAMHGMILKTVLIAHLILQQYVSFSTVTRRSLHHALSENNIPSPSEEVVTYLMSAYNTLSAFPDVTPALERLLMSSSVTPVVFSNGTQRMVSDSVHRSPDLSPYSKAFEEIITVEEVQKFKPHPDVYYHLAKKMKRSKESMGEIWLVSGNPFDVVTGKGCRDEGLLGG
ncbi:MAG: hypothetical protein Q9209_006607 [Squamulea sp. 1 TL-2023]